jgi:hypothetical protein
MNQEKISRAVELQDRANKEIDAYGQTTDSTINELMEIVDSLTPEEQDEFIRQCMTELGI